MTNFLQLKTKLLQTNYFIDNSYLDDYVNLIINNLLTVKIKFCTQKHHILQKKYFKIINIKIDNSKDNLVNLLYKDHILAHYYLCKCTITDLRAANIKAIVSLVNRDYRELNEEWLNANLIDFQDLYSEAKLAVSKFMQNLPHPGHAQTIETRKRIAESNKGKKMSDEAKANMQKNHYDCVGEKNPAYGRHWYNNGEERLYLNDVDVIPEGFIRGNLPLSEEDKTKKSISNKGKHGHARGTRWFNNGIVAIMSKECPNGFVEGRLPMNRTVEHVGTKNKVWITDGKTSKYIDKNMPIPDGWRLGRTRVKK